MLRLFSPSLTGKFLEKLKNFNKRGFQGLQGAGKYLKIGMDS